MPLSSNASSRPAARGQDGLQGTALAVLGGLTFVCCGFCEVLLPSRPLAAQGSLTLQAAGVGWSQSTAHPQD